MGRRGFCSCALLGLALVWCLGGCGSVAGSPPAEAGQDTSGAAAQPAAGAPCAEPAADLGIECERRTLTTDKVAGMPLTKFSFEMPKGWEMTESVRDAGQLIVLILKSGDPVPIKVWVKAADAAQAAKWLAEKDFMTNELSRTTCERGGFKTRRALVADKSFPTAQKALHGLSQPPYYLMVQGGGPENWRDLYMKVADHIAATLRIEP